MTDKSTRQLKSWTYAHPIKEDNLDKAVGRFRTQIENVTEELEKREDLEPRYDIKAEIQIVDVQEENDQAEGENKLTLFDWG